MNVLRSQLGWLVCFACLASFTVAPLAAGEDPPAKKPAKAAADKKAEAEKKAESDKAKAAKAKAEAEKAAEKAIEERYRVPDGDAEALLKFINDLKTFEPADAKEFFAHRQKAIPAIVAAANKIVEKEMPKDSPARLLALGYLLLGRVTEIPKMSEEEMKNLLADSQAHFKGRKPSEEDLQVGAAIAAALATRNEKLAAEAYTSFGETFAATAEDDTAKSLAEEMLAVGRRMGLVGNEIKLSGDTVAGEMFDIASLKGKVVLVDFWATWCGPCVAEQPNMKKNYEAYKDRGFEIVGISLDQERSALDAFLEENKVAWITLHDKENEGQHSAVRFYGISGIPAMFLVGKDGKVVSTNARGEELDRLLAELLGPIEANKEEKKE